ncbi:MAG TPA: glycosyltransferase [Nitrososphaeraceae archaeon]|nr:glycosyltransferase [Nitrososphaeraceae archaeon]
MNQISIGIISYNEEKNIVNLLNSIKYQYLDKFFIKEIIISDDSNDNTPFLIKDFIKKNPQLLIKLFHHNERRGAYAGWNEIFKEAIGYCLVLYDADVILAKKTTYSLVNAFSQDIGLCASNPQPRAHFSIYGRATKFITDWLQNIRKTGLSQFTVMGRGLAIKSDLAKKITIPENIIAIDYFLQIKVLELGKQVVYVNSAILYFKTPENLDDFLSQVLRANFGHKQLSFYYKTKKLPIISNIKITLKSILSDPFGGIATLYCYCFIPYYALRNKNKISSKWEIAQSTKF